MKECPECHALYEDAVSFCTKDGTRLQPVETKPETPPQPLRQDAPKPPSKKNNNVWKTVLIVLGVVAVVLFAVFNHLRNAATYLRTEPALVTAPKAGGDCIIDIDSVGYMWSINHKPDWVKVDEMEKNFTLTVAPNKTGRPREGSITVQSGKLLAQVVIRQNGVATAIQASEKQFHFDKNGGEGSVQIITDGGDWQATGPEWLGIRKSGNDQLSIRCPDNDGDYRTGSVVVTEDNIRYTIDVIQSGYCNACHGNGEVDCIMCGGLGGSYYGLIYSQCFGCGGHGKVRCSYCGGNGYRE